MQDAEWIQLKLYLESGEAPWTTRKIIGSWNRPLSCN